MIVCSAQARQEVKDKFHCSESTVSNALRFLCDSFLCRQIRSYVMNFKNGYFIPT